MAMKMFLPLLAILCIAATPPTVNSKYRVTLAWDANTETDLAGYRLYEGSVPGVYDRTFEIAAPATTFERSELSAKTTFYWVLTAFNTSGLESLPSNEVRYETPPWGASPAGFRVESVRIVMDVPP